VTGPALEILLAEDNPADVRMTREALAELRVEHRLHVVDNGESALAFILRTGEFEDAPRPDLVLLDLSLPVIGGHSVLVALRSLRKASWFPVVVLTGSRDRNALERSLELEADRHVFKPARLRELAEELRTSLGLVRPRSA
jgi:chemotaxis family two-component system response regulator Rcp1